METEALRDREARLNAMYSTSLEYIGLLTPDGTVIDCNGASLEFAGNTRAEVVGKHFAGTPWFTGTPGAPELVHRAIAHANSGETFRSELPLIRPNGGHVNFRFLADSGSRREWGGCVSGSGRPGYHRGEAH